MNVLVDTSIWSLALRRRRLSTSDETAELSSLIEQGRVVLLGFVRQELLSGIRERRQFLAVREHLRAFPDVPTERNDFEAAAAFSNRCRARGVQGSPVDFLICAVAARRKLSVFTSDQDFERYARILPVRLHSTFTP